MNIDIKTVAIIIVVLFLVWNFLLCDGGSSSEKFDLHERNQFVSGDYSPLLVPTRMVYNDTENVLLSDDYKFGPKEFVMVKHPYKLSDNEKCARERDLVANSKTERNLGEWTHRGPHGPRNTGYSPRYHGEKTVQYLPAWPSVADDWETVQVMSKDMLANPNDYPVLATSDKVDLEKLVY
jgi:hypothetical protein